MYFLTAFVVCFLIFTIERRAYNLSDLPLLGRREPIYPIGKVASKPNFCCAMDLSLIQMMVGRLTMAVARTLATISPSIGKRALLWLLALYI